MCVHDCNVLSMHCKYIHYKKYSFTLTVKDPIYFHCTYDIHWKYSSQWLIIKLAQSILSKALRYAASRRVDHADTHLWIGSTIFQNPQLSYADLSGHSHNPRSCCTVFPCVPKYTAIFAVCSSKVCGLWLTVKRRQILWKI